MRFAMSFDYFDHYRLRSIEQSLQHLRKAAATPNPFVPKQADVETLQREVGELRLLVAVLYRLLIDKGQCSETEVNALLSTLDLADGRRDGAFHGDAVSGQPLVKPEVVEEENLLPKIRVT
jgi:hypothetical protein